MKHVGTIKWLDFNKGYGFVEVKGYEIYSPITEIKDARVCNLKEGDRVVLEIEMTDRGPCGRNIRKIERLPVT